MYTTYLEHGHTDRSDCLWGWLSLNLCTGHGMMRIIKSADGLYNCKGVDELQRAIFLLSTYITGTMCKCKNWQEWIWYHQINTILHVCQDLLGSKMVCWKSSTTYTNTIPCSMGLSVQIPCTLLLMPRRYPHLLMLIIHTLLGRPSFIVWEAKLWQISSSREEGKKAAILSLVLDFILSGSTLAPIDHIHYLVGLLVFYKCVHKWSHDATILQIWKIMVRTTATP